MAHIGNDLCLALEQAMAWWMTNISWRLKKMRRMWQTWMGTSGIILTGTKTIWNVKQKLVLDGTGCNCFLCLQKRIFWVHSAETIWLNYNCINSLSIWYLVNIWCKKWLYWFQYDDSKKQIFVKTNCIVIRKSLVKCKYL
jgi:hypothetical protein